MVYKVLMLGLIGVSALCQAQFESTESGNAYYIGANLGSTHFSDDGLYPDGLVDKSDSQWSVYGGYQLTPKLSIELNYSDLGIYYHNFLPGDYLYVYSNEYRVLSGIGKFTRALNERVDVFAKGGLGLVFLEQDVRFSSGTKTVFDSLGFGFYLGVGGAINITPRFSLNALMDVNFYEVEAKNLWGTSNYYIQAISSTSVGMEYKF